MDSLSITLPIYWKISSNDIYSGKHWTKRNTLKNNYRQAYVLSLKTLKNDFESVDIQIDYFFKKNALDSDNCSYMTKLIIDCIVKAGILKDDSTKYINWVKMRSQKGGNDMMIITLSKPDDQLY